MRITRDVYLVGGGNLGFNLSDYADCHIYAVSNDKEIVLVDAGLGPGVDQVIENMKDDGLDPSKVSKVFATHYHADHAGALHKWRSLTGAQICTSTRSATAIRAGDAKVIGLEAAKKAGFYPNDFQLVPSAVDIEFEEGQEFAIGALTLIPYFTPGHSQDHFAFLLKGGDRICLFSGDSLFWGGTIILQNIPDCDLQSCISTIERLSELCFDALLPGHLTISVKDGKRHAISALAIVRSMGIPRNAV